MNLRLLSHPWASLRKLAVVNESLFMLFVPLSG